MHRPSEFVNVGGQRMAERLVAGHGPGLGGHAVGIGRALVMADGRVSFRGVAAQVPSPSWLTVSNGIVYAALEETGEVASFRIDNGALRMLSRHRTAGAAPCHLAVAGDALVVACYRTGVVGVHIIDADGAAGPLAQSLSAEGHGPRDAQAGPHAHHVLTLSDGRVLTLDLGADKLHVHGWSDGVLTRVASVDFPAGTGPRDLCKLPDGNIAALGEWGCDVFVLARDSDTFRIVSSAVLHGAEPACQAAGLDVSSDGRFLYSALRGVNLVSIIALDGDSVRPVGSVPCGGAWPRHLTVEGDLLHVSNQQSSTIASFRLGLDGWPVPIGEPVSVATPTQLIRIR
jgi:6-phosphogluconolactonase